MIFNPEKSVFVVDDLASVFVQEALDQGFAEKGLQSATLVLKYKKNEMNAVFTAGTYHAEKNIDNAIKGASKPISFPRETVKAKVTTATHFSVTIENGVVSTKLLKTHSLCGRKPGVTVRAATSSAHKKPIKGMRTGSAQFFSMKPSL